MGVREFREGPSREEQKQKPAQLQASQKRAEAETQIQLAREAKAAGRADNGSEIFPPLPWRPRIVLRLAALHWKQNIQLCRRIHFMMRQFRKYSQWLSENARFGAVLSQEQLESMIDITRAIDSHVNAVRWTRRVKAPGCIAPEELLDLERRLAKLYEMHRRQWSPEYRAELKGARVAQEIEMAPLTAIMNDIHSDQNE